MCTQCLASTSIDCREDPLLGIGELTVPMRESNFKELPPNAQFRNTVCSSAHREETELHLGGIKGSGLEASCPRQMTKEKVY